MGSYSWFICWLSVLCCLSQTAYGSSSEHTSSDGFSLGDSTYETGPYNVSTKTNLQSTSCCKMMVTVPDAEGDYPVIQFQHGTCLSGADYQTVIDQIASWGFIVVAPQMYTCFLFMPPSDAVKEINDARGILSWLPTGLGPALRPWTAARPDFTRIALAGQSRGGKVVFGVALNVANSSVSVPGFAAVVGLDPVDGAGEGWPKGQLKPPVLKHKNDSLHVGVPSLVVGTGLGPTGLQPCAPQDFGHKFFYGDVAPPAFHFVVPKQGHMDFCDCSKFSNLCWLCAGKPSTRPQMHKFAAGIVVAFLQDALLHNSTAFDAAYEHFDQAPVALDPPESKGSIPTSGFAPTEKAPRQHASA